MLLPFKRRDGKPVFIESKIITRLRAATPSDNGAASIVYHTKGSLDSSDKVADVLKVLQQELAMIELTAPNGSKVYIDAAKIIIIAQPLKGTHAETAKAIVQVGDHEQQVTETVAEVRKLVDAALSPAPAGAPMVMRAAVASKRGRKKTAVA